MTNNKSPLFNTIFVLYYVFLFLLETPLLGRVGVPSSTIRIAYLLFLVAPVGIYNRSYIPIVVFIAYTISKFGTAVTMMPTEVWYYVPILLFLLFLPNNQSKGKFLFPIPVIILAFCILYTDLLTSQSLHDSFFCFLILILLFVYINPQRGNDAYSIIFSHSFVIIGVILALEILLAGGEYTQAYGNSNLERTEWVDANYFGGVIGMGVIACAVLLFTRKCHILIKAYHIIAMLVMLAALVVNASRGALLASISGILVILIGKGLKLWQKVLIVAVASAFVVWLYNNSYFELLEYRFENESGGGSGRTFIWGKKWGAFMNESSIFQLLFGVGYSEGLRVGFSQEMAFHNDYLAFLVDYGFVGALTFVSMLLYPLKESLFKNKAVLGCLVFLLVNCATLEPFSLGLAVYYFFWLYMFAMAQKNNTSNSVVVSKGSVAH